MSGWDLMWGGEVKSPKNQRIVFREESTRPPTMSKRCRLSEADRKAAEDRRIAIINYLACGRVSTAREISLTLGWDAGQTISCMVRMGMLRRVIGYRPKWMLP